MLRWIQAYGVRGDAEKAREFCGLAAVAGIEKARKRLEALKSSSPPDAVSFRGKRTAQRKSVPTIVSWDARKVAGNFEQLKFRKRCSAATFRMMR